MLRIFIEVIDLYQTREFKVEFILIDDESSSMAVSLLWRRMLLNGSSAKEHFLEINRMIRTITERYRGKVNTLPNNMGKLLKLVKI